MRAEPAASPSVAAINAGNYFAKRAVLANNKKKLYSRISDIPMKLAKVDIIAVTAGNRMVLHRKMLLLHLVHDQLHQPDLRTVISSAKSEINST